jgi:hypothetical protein
VELRRWLLDALVLLPIRKMVRGMRLGKTRRREWIRGSGVCSTLVFRQCPEAYSGEIQSSIDLTPWRILGEIREEETERGGRGIL